MGKSKCTVPALRTVPAYRKDPRDTRRPFVSQPGIPLFFFDVCFGSILQKKVCKDSKDKGTCNACDRNRAEINRQTADTCDEDNGYDEEIFVFVKINVLNHLQTGDCDESVKSHTNAAHYT